MRSPSDTDSTRGTGVPRAAPRNRHATTAAVCTMPNIRQTAFLSRRETVVSSCVNAPNGRVGERDSNTRRILVAMRRTRQYARTSFAVSWPEPEMRV